MHQSLFDMNHDPGDVKALGIRPDVQVGLFTGSGRMHRSVVLSVNGYRLEVDGAGPSMRLADVLRSETKFKVRVHSYMHGIHA